MTDILDAKKRLNAFGLTSNTKKGCIFVLLLFIFFAAVEYWASPGCDSGINAESRSGRRVFGLRHLDSKGKLLTAIAQEFLCASDCMLVPHNKGDSQQLLDGSGGCVFLSDCCHCQKCQPLSYRPACMTHVCCPLVVLNGLLLTSWMIYCHGGVISHIDSCEGWNGTEMFCCFFLKYYPGIIDKFVPQCTLRQSALSDSLSWLNHAHVLRISKEMLLVFLFPWSWITDLGPHWANS